MTEKDTEQGGFGKLLNDVLPATDKPLGDNAKKARLNGLLSSSSPGSNREHDVIYMTLDCLLDTRMGIIAQHFPDLAVKLLDSKKYPLRLIDKFGPIGFDQFQELYAKRDVDTLKHSILTNLPFFLQRIIKDCMVHATKVKMDQELTFIVNTYPYHLDEDLQEMLHTCVRYHTFDTSRVEIVHITDKDLTPAYVRENLDIMIMYSCKDWLYMHKEAFDRYLCPHVTLVIPQLFQNGMIDPEGIVVCKKIGKTPFELAEQTIANLIRLKIMPTSLFCINESMTKEKAANIVLGLEIQPEDIEQFAKENGYTVKEEASMKPNDINNLPLSEDPL